MKTNKVFIEPGHMIITQEADRDGFMPVKGSASQTEWNDLKNEAKMAQSVVDSFSRGGHPASREKANSARLTLAKINYDYAINHPHSYVGANQIMYFSNIFKLDSLKRLYDSYAPEIKESTDGRRLASEIKSRTVGLPGTMAFQFSVKDKDAKELSLADFKGKYVLLDF